MSMKNKGYGGERGIRTLDTGFSPYNGLANRRLQPLGHLSAVHFSLAYHRALNALPYSQLSQCWCGPFLNGIEVLTVPPTAGSRPRSRTKPWQSAQEAADFSSA